MVNGAGYEKWMGTVSLPRSKLCDTSAAFAADYITLEGAVTHSHGPEGEHAHGEIAFTTWVDSTLAVRQADAIRTALAKLRPEHEDDFQRNFDALKGDLENLDQQISDTVAKAPECLVLFSHPVYQYFARRYGLNARSVHWEPDEPPTDAMWAELKELLQEHPTKWMIWEGQPAAATAERLAQMGVESVVFDPCGNTSEEGDYLRRQQGNLQGLARVFSGTDGGQ